MAEGTIIIREAVARDGAAILHLYSCFMFDSFLLRFGTSFVERYLKAIMGSKHAVTLVAAREDVVGFIMASLNVKRLFAGLFLHPGIFREWTKQALMHPRSALGILALLRYPLATHVPDADAELLFIAVDPACRHQGLAAGLIEEVLRRMRAQGIKKVKVSTHADNGAVNALLTERGFKAVNSLRLFKKCMLLHIRELG